MGWMSGANRLVEAEECGRSGEYGRRILGVLYLGGRGPRELILT